VTGEAAGSGTRSVTPLRRQLSERVAARPTALDAFRLARRTFLAGERVELTTLAAQLGVDRATLHRWVGGRDKLLTEVLWSLLERTAEVERERAPGRGGERIAAFVTSVIDDLVSHAGMRHFLATEGQLALRLLTQSGSEVQKRAIAVVRDLLQEETDRGTMNLGVDLDEVAYAVIRIGEAYIYRELFTGESPDARRAAPVLRLLLR
jgi:hypothetical protein